MTGIGTKPVNRVPVLVGLAIAWGGVAALVSPAAQVLGPPWSQTTHVLGLLVFWALLGIIVAIVIFWEKRPLASMGLRRPFRWASVGWGLMLAAALMYVLVPALTWVCRGAGLAGFEAGLAKISVLPLWLRIMAVISAGVVEDGLFLGYAFTRLKLLTGSYWSAGCISITASSLLHFPHWGAGPVLIYLPVGVVTTAFFVWRGDLLSNMIAHVTVDGVALVIGPAVSQSG